MVVRWQCPSPENDTYCGGQLVGILKCEFNKESEISSIIEHYWGLENWTLLRYHKGMCNNKKVIDEGWSMLKLENYCSFNTIGSRRLQELRFGLGSVLINKQIALFSVEFTRRRPPRCTCGARRTTASSRCSRAAPGRWTLWTRSPSGGRRGTTWPPRACAESSCRRRNRRSRREWGRPSRSGGQRAHDQRLEIWGEMNYSLGLPSNLFLTLILHIHSGYPRRRERERDQSFAPGWCFRQRTAPGKDVGRNVR